MKFSVFSETKKFLQDNETPHLALSSVSSTNDLAKEKALHEKDQFKFYLAETQTAGRGRGHNSWHNTLPGESLLASFSYSLKRSPQAITGPLVGLGVYRALKKIWPSKKLSIKAPNDLYWHDKKIAGLLTETVSAGENIRLIIGLGLNVFSHPQNVLNAGHLSNQVEISTSHWHQFLHHLTSELFEVSRAAQAPHLTEAQRGELLEALNALPLLQEKYTNLSPFGDLTTASHVVSWKQI